MLKLVQYENVSLKDDFVILLLCMTTKNKQTFKWYSHSMKDVIVQTYKNGMST